MMISQETAARTHFYKMVLRAGAVLRTFVKSIFNRSTTTKLARSSTTAKNKTNISSGWWIGYFVCLCGFTLTICTFYPGYMSPDSTATWLQGRAWVFRDIHSPVMSYLWGISDRMLPGPGLMFILQNLVFWGGAAVFWKSTWRKSFRLGIGLVAFAFMPQILSQLTTVWKDVGLGASLFFAVSLIYCSDQTKAKFPLMLSILFLFYGYTVRLNAVPAVISIALWTGVVACRIFQPKFGRFSIAGFMSGIIYFLILSAAVYVTNENLTAGQTAYPFQQVYLYDLSAISIARNEVVFPDYITQGENFSFDNVKAQYNIRSVNYLIYGDKPNLGDKPILTVSYETANIAALRSEWFEAVTNNPGAYFSHRWHIFAQLIGFTRNTVSNPYWEGYDANPVEFRPEQNFVNKILMRYFRTFRKFPFFMAFVWLLPCFYFIYRGLKERLQEEWDLVFVLSASSILFTVAYFIVAPSTEFRYLFWTVISSAVSCIFAVYLSKRKTNQQSTNINI